MNATAISSYPGEDLGALSPTLWVALFGVAVLAGLINSVASGGSLLTYPTLLVVGLTPIAATATVLLALLPANVSAMRGFGSELREVRRQVPIVVVLGVAGSAIGTMLLSWLGAGGFEPLVPWFILGATGLYAAGPSIRCLAERKRPGAAAGGATSVALFATSIYAGFFGSGAGNVFLGILTVRGHTRFLQANVLKNVILVATNVVAAAVYTFTDLVHWPAAVPVLIGSLIGGGLGGALARQVPMGALRISVVAFGLAASVWAFSNQQAERVVVAGAGVAFLVAAHGLMKRARASVHPMMVNQHCQA